MMCDMLYRLYMYASHLVSICCVCNRACLRIMARIRGEAAGRARDDTVVARRVSWDAHAGSDRGKGLEAKY